MEKAELENLLAKASKIKTGYYTSKERDSMRKLDGAKRFKRKALGLCRRSVVRSLDEIAQLLHKTRMVSSVEEGRKITPDIFNVNEVIRYGSYLNSSFLTFDKVQNAKGKEAYKIGAIYID